MCYISEAFHETHPGGGWHPFGPLSWRQETPLPACHCHHPLKGIRKTQLRWEDSHGLFSVVEASQLVCGAKLRGNYKFLVYGELWSPAKA
jgi:hypothetical protein